LFDCSLRVSEDYDWFVRAIELKANILAISKVCLIRRFHHQNMTKGLGLRGVGMFSVLKKSIDRRRQEADHAITPLAKLADFLESEPPP